jgi:hypothetical protein
MWIEITIASIIVDLDPLTRKNGEEKDGRGMSTKKIRGFYETNP